MDRVPDVSVSERGVGCLGNLEHLEHIETGRVPGTGTPWASAREPARVLGKGAAAHHLLTVTEYMGLAPR